MAVSSGSVGASGMLCLLTTFVAFLVVDGQNLSCDESCTATYPKHTFEKGYLQDSCERGCRFYVASCRHSVHSPMDQCHKACNESYVSQEDSESKLLSCQQGCTFMKPIEDSRLQSLNEEMAGIQAYMAQRRLHYMMDALMQRFLFDDSWPARTDPDHSVNSHMTWYIVNVRPQDAGGETVRFGSRQHPWMDVQEAQPDAQAQPMLPDVNEEQRVPGGVVSLDYYEGASSGCQWIVRKVGVPRLLIVSSILFMLLAMLWICCSTANSRRKRERKALRESMLKAQIKYHKELEYLDHSKGFIPEGITLQAFPLPEKSAKL